MFTFLCLAVLAFLQQNPQPNVPLCWDVCKQTCTTLSGANPIDQCMVNCPCKCSQPCKNVCNTYKLGLDCLNKCGCPPEMEKFFVVEKPAKTINLQPTTPEMPVAPQAGVAPNPMMPMMEFDYEDMYMMQQMQQMQNQLRPQTPPTPAPVAPTQNPIVPPVPTTAPIAPMLDMNAYMQQKMQMKIMKCQMECQYKCQMYSMNNPQMMQQCLSVCTC